MIKKTLLSLAVFVSFLPLIASAHATPVRMQPESSGRVDTAPSQVVIQFSEHVDPSASLISVTSPKGKQQGVVQIDPSDRRILSVPVSDDGEGTYLVSWSVVSSDDGHFTKGTYAFVVGENTPIATTTVDTEIVEVATTPEALAMTVELLGNGIIWATLLLFIFAIRKMLKSKEYAREEQAIRRGYIGFLAGAALLAFVGGALQLAIKGSDLANLRDVSFANALPVYLMTTAGSATLVRMAAVVLVFVLVVLGRKKIFKAQHVSVYEWLMMASMFVFAFYRAKISHATANAFHPHFSIAVNFLHLIEKDVWAGVVLILLSLSVSQKMRRFLFDLIPHAFLVLAIDLASVSVTASYIVWLHLKTLSNLFGTQWGNTFLALFIAALCVVGLRVYHTAARALVPKWFQRTLTFTLAVEFAFALLVVYYSSVVIITSPPLPQPATAVYSAEDQGLTITLQRDAYEDGMLLLTASGGAAETPVVTVKDDSGTSGTVSLDLAKRFDGGYVFPQSLLVGNGPFSVSITVPQSGGYDAHAAFDIPKQAFTPAPDWESHRPFDALTATAIAFGSAALVLAFLLFVFSSSTIEFVPVKLRIPIFAVATGFLLTMFVAVRLISLFTASTYANPFKSECESDGNMWHVMLPTKAGIPVSQSAAEGCMWGMGNYEYMFPDQREYDYYSSLKEATVTLDHASSTLTAGVPETFTVSLKNADGSPADLFVDMEKLIHVVIVSKDETVFAHIHPDDQHPLTKEEINSSTFTLTYTFPKAGRYLMSVDYSHGLKLGSKQFLLDVAGVPEQEQKTATYPSPGKFEGYDVSLYYLQPFAGEVTTLQYTITKDGKPVTDIVPYLSAAMHISVVKNDFSAFIHTHGEVHVPGTPLPPIIVKNGQVIHSMAMMILPPTLGPKIEGHLIFPSPGLYTIWGQFKVGDTVIPTSFTVQVE